MSPAQWTLVHPDCKRGPSQRLKHAEGVDDLSTFFGGKAWLGNMLGEGVEDQLVPRLDGSSRS